MLGIFIYMPENYILSDLATMEINNVIKNVNFVIFKNCTKCY